MTREEQVKRLEELKTVVDQAVTAYNSAMVENKLNEAAEADSKIEKAVSDYSTIMQDIVFAECAAAPDPMLEAVKRLSYEVIGVKDTKNGESKIPTREAVTKEKQIDLGKLHKFIPGGIGADKQWIYRVEKFNMLLTAEKARDLGVKPERLKEISDSFAMADISKQFDMGKNPCSKTNMLKTLRAVVTAMIGEEYAAKALSHDVNFLLTIYARKSRKALTVTCANHSRLRGYMAEICHRIVLEKGYDVEYKAAKK